MENKEDYCEEYCEVCKYCGKNWEMCMSCKFYDETVETIQYENKEKR